MAIRQRSAHRSIALAGSRRADRRRRCRLVAVLLVVSGVVPACLPDPVPWMPSEEDTGPDSGPDPGTCEDRRDCGQVVK